MPLLIPIAVARDPKRARRDSKRMNLAERMYEARKLRERVPSEFLPLFDHLLNLAANSYRHGQPQDAGRRLREAAKLAERKTSTYYDPHMTGGHLANRRGYKGYRPFAYLTGRDPKRRRKLQALMAEHAEYVRSRPVPARYKSRKRHRSGHVQHRYRVGDVLERPGHSPARVTALTFGSSADSAPEYRVINGRGVRDIWNEDMNLRLVQRRGKRYARERRRTRG